MLIYCSKITPRIEYTFKVMFEFVCKCEYRYTNNEEEYGNYQGPKINYSKDYREDGVSIFPADILLSDEIKEWSIRHGEHNGHKVIFTHTEKSDLPYDPVAACFFMCSRYEEYLPFKADKHNRFPLKNNLSFQLGFHEDPVVHYWTKDLINEIIQKFPPFSFEKTTFSFQPTFDIDNAYAFLYKNPVRTYGALIKSLLRDPDQLRLRLNVLKGKASDPYDTYEYIAEINEKYQSKPNFFVLTSSRHRYDKNIDPASPAFEELIGKLSKIGVLGIHPSYESNNDTEKLKEEIENLSDIAKKPVTSSRQHFLMMRFPKTYENLIKEGIREDYTMGFAEGPGFRAGIASSYPFFNIATNEITELIIHPFFFMESTFMYYSKSNVSETGQKLEEIIDKVRNVGGSFKAIWHNESLGEWDKWKDWRKVFEKMYEHALTTKTGG